MGRRGVQVVVVLLHVLAVVPLGTGEAEQPLLEDGVASVPQRQREAQPPLAVAHAEQPVLPPAVRPAARVVVRKRVPRRAVLGIVLAHGAPLALREVRAPALPVAFAPSILGESLAFVCWGRHAGFPPGDHGPCCPRSPGDRAKRRFDRRSLIASPESSSTPHVPSVAGRSDQGRRARSGLAGAAEWPAMPRARARPPSASGRTCARACAGWLRVVACT